MIRPLLQAVLQNEPLSVRDPSYLYEHMFPRLRQTFSTALVDRIDDLVEFTTLGEYVLADDLRPIAIGPADRACEGARSHFEPRATSPRSRDVCPPPDWAWPAGS